MYRIFYLLPVCLSLSMYSLAQLPSAAEIKKLKIKKIIRTEEGKSPEMGTAIWYYDANGYDTAYYTYGTRNYYKKNSYNGNNRITAVERFTGKGKLIEKTTFVYKPDGSLQVVTSDMEFGFKTTEDRNKQGNPVKKVIPDGSVYHYEYNAKDQLVKIKTVPANGGIEFTAVYSYNKAGKQDKVVKTGDYASTVIYEYDQRGLLKKETITNESEEDEKTVFNYSYEYL